MKELRLNLFNQTIPLPFNNRGKIKVRTRKESAILEKGQLLTLYENTKYKLTTSEETVFLLTIAYGILQPAEN